MAHGCRREAVAICGHLREPHRCLGWPWCGGGGGVVVLKCREGCSSAGSRMARLCRPEPGETMHN